MHPGENIEWGDVVVIVHQIDSARGKTNSEQEWTLGAIRGVVIRLPLLRFFHLEFFTTPRHVGDGGVGRKLDLRKHCAVHVHNDDLTVARPKIDLEN